MDWIKSDGQENQLLAELISKAPLQIAKIVRTSKTEGSLVVAIMNTDCDPPCYRSVARVITDTECSGSVTVKDGPVLMVFILMCAASGCEKSLEAVSSLLFTVSMRAFFATRAPVHKICIGKA